MAYYDLGAILAEEERVPTEFLTDAAGLGFLDSTAQDADLKRGAKLDLPLWLAAAVADRGWADIQAPKAYAHRFRTYLLADPAVINLRERSTNYYETGLRLAAFVKDSRALVDTLVKTLSMRYRDILDKSQNSRNEDLSQISCGMTELEQEIFFAGHAGASELFRFKRRECESLSAPGKAAAVANKRARRV